MFTVLQSHRTLTDVRQHTRIDKAVRQQQRRSRSLRSTQLENLRQQLGSLKGVWTRIGAFVHAVISTNHMQTAHISSLASDEVAHMRRTYLAVGAPQSISDLNDDTLVLRRTVQQKHSNVLLPLEDEVRKGNRIVLLLVSLRRLVIRPLGDATEHGSGFPPHSKVESTKRGTRHEVRFSKLAHNI